MEICQVERCRFNMHHRTEYHMCKTCHKCGHGFMECKNSEKINKLAEIINKENLDNIIIIPYGHTNRNISFINNSNIEKKVRQVKLDLKNKIGQYTMYKMDLGYALFARNNDNIIEYIFLSNEEEQDPKKSSTLNIFLSGYVKCKPYKPYKSFQPFSSLFRRCMLEYIKYKKLTKININM